MLVCDACDNGYHTFCLQPAMDSVPTDPWKCRVSHTFFYSTCLKLCGNMLVYICIPNKICILFFPNSMFFQRCRVCTECGVRGMVLPGSSQWFENYSVCEACQCHRSSVCGVCSKPTSPTMALQCCSICHRSVK